MENVVSKRLRNRAFISFILMNTLGITWTLIVDIRVISLPVEIITTLLYAFMTGNILNLIFLSYYFKQRGFLMSAISNLILGIISVPMIYVAFYVRPNLFETNLLFPIFGVLYLCALTSYALSFIIPKKTRKYRYLFFHGLICLTVLVMNFLGAVIRIEYWQMLLVTFHVLTTLFMVLHLFKEQGVISENNPEILDQ